MNPHVTRAARRFALVSVLLLTTAVARSAGLNDRDFPAVDQLPATSGLPDLFTMLDGSKVATASDWQRRRQEIRALILYYQYGRIPPPPDQVTAEVTKRRPHRSGKGREEWLTLKIGSKEQLPMRVVLYLPYGDGPYPVVIREEGTLGRTEQVPLFLDHQYMFIEYARHDLDPDLPGVSGPAQRAYPDYDWETLAVWAWGGMRVLDYLETRDDVDLKRVAITGHSRGGKMALLAGALDERFALVVPNGSGAGGAGSYRILGPGAESLGMNDKPHWYNDRLRSFAQREERLPFDQHFLKALVAPRLLLCTESLDDAFANPFGTQATSMVARQVYRFLGSDLSRNGIHFRHGPHDSTTEDWQALLDFAEWHFFGRTPDGLHRFWQTPFPVAEGLLASRPLTSKVRDGEVGAARSLEPAEGESSFMQWMVVGAPGNAPDRNHYGHGRFGAVKHVFRIGAHQVTNHQYARFLNAVARSDNHHLYHEHMSSHVSGGIERSGSDGEYVYRVKQAMGYKPVNFVSWPDAIRFCNWMHNGRPQGRQDENSTEDGAYSLASAPANIRRKGDARVFLPTEDEWYKAAYFDPHRGIAGSYRLFPDDGDDPSPFPVAPDAISPFGVAGMADDNWEWNETPTGLLFQGLRSGAWFQGNNRQAAGDFYSNPSLELHDVGFRVAAR